MENAVDALKMAAAVMIFVLALSVSITAFSEARIASTTLLDYRDREASLGESDYWISDESNKQIIVGMETIIPTIYRSYSDESFKVVFKFTDSAYGLFYRQQDDGTYKPYCVIGRIYTNSIIGPLSNEKEFIEKILYNKNSSSINELLKQNSKLKFKDDDESFFDKYTDKKFKEYSGIYYQGEEEGLSDIPDANRQAIRVITFEEQV